MRILGIVICYNPNIVELYKNINSYIHYIDQLIVWQNTPNIKEELLFEDKINNKLYKKVIFLGNGENKGIAFPLNEALKIICKKQDDQYTHLLTMDQDSTWVNFKTYIEELAYLDSDAIFSPNINDELMSSEKVLEVKTCITSGAVFPKKVLCKIGEFNEEYSVDCVDYDFCFKANAKGFLVIKVLDAKLVQTYGEPVISKIFKFQNHVYSSKRLFFIVRNHILLWRDYPKQINSRFAKVILIDIIFGKIVKILLMENKKWSKINAVLKGVIMGLINNRKHRY